MDMHEQNDRLSSATGPCGTTVALRTRRMLLREFRHGDEANLLALHRDDRVTRLLIDGSIDSPMRAFHFINQLAERARANPGLGIWRASSLETDEFLGFFSLVRSPGGADVEIGARLLPRYWGRNLAVEGGRELLRHGFADLGLPRIVSFSHPDNRPVHFVLGRLGFTSCGRARHDDHDVSVHALERADWEAGRALGAEKSRRARTRLRA